MGLKFRGFSIKPVKCIGNKYFRRHLISLILFTHKINEIKCPTKIYDFTVIKVITKKSLYFMGAQFSLVLWNPLAMNLQPQRIMMF